MGQVKTTQNLLKKASWRTNIYFYAYNFFLFVFGKFLSLGLLLKVLFQYTALDLQFDSKFYGTAVVVIHYTMALSHGQGL